MKTSIILLRCDITHKLFELTQNAVKTLKADETILVDNASTVGQIEWGDIKIKNDVNVGYCRAVNQGFAKSTGDLIAVANNDIKVSPNWKQVSKEIFEEHPDVGSVHFRMIGYNTPVEYGFNTWVEGKERWCSSSFFVIRREAFLGYDENYKEGGYDDWDFWYRVRLEGWKTAYTTKACYQHKHSSTYLALDDGKSRSERDIRNREYFKSKFGGYAEDLFQEAYPDQFKENYYEFFNQL